MAPCFMERQVTYHAAMQACESSARPLSVHAAGTGRGGEISDHTVFQGRPTFVRRNRRSGPRDRPVRAHESVGRAPERRRAAARRTRSRLTSLREAVSVNLLFWRLLLFLPR